MPQRPMPQRRLIPPWITEAEGSVTTITVRRAGDPEPEPELVTEARRRGELVICLEGTISLDRGS